MGRRILALVALSFVALAFGSARAGAASLFAPCAAGSPVECATVAVPLDRTGIVPGQVSLHVERLPASGTPRGVMLLLAGGPGQPGSVFNLADAQFYHLLFPAYTLATYDNRGTGASGPLSCPSLQQQLTIQTQEAQLAQLVGECGTSLGEGRRFYSTRDHAADLEAVRQALGVDRIGIWGTSYGTKLAEVYAFLYPDHVERLLLNSVVLPEGDDPFDTSTLRAIPAALASYCAGGTCRAATGNFAGEVIALANRLGAKPISGRVAGGPSVRLDGLAFLNLVVDGDLSPGVAAELPAAVHAASLGRPQALLRLGLLDSASLSAEDLNAALFAATNCDDGPLPWASDTPLAQRQQLYAGAIAGLPAGALGPFGPWATGIGGAAMCKLWPEQPPLAPFTPVGVPNVPVLVLAGDRDARTPPASAAAVAARFPQAQLLVVPNVGHDVVDTDYSGCALRAVRDWMQGSPLSTKCGRAPNLIDPLPAFAKSLAAVAPAAHVPGTAGRTLGATLTTVREAAAAVLAGLTSSSGPIPGLSGGTLVASGIETLTLKRYSLVPGVALTGTLKLDASTAQIVPLWYVGTLAVGGSKSVRGKLVIEHNRVRGILGTRRLDVPVR